VPAAGREVARRFLRQHMIRTTRRSTSVAALVAPLVLPLVFPLALALTGCAQKEAAVPAEEAKVPYRPTSSLQEIMLSVVDPSADVLWESVAVVSTEKGTEERKPGTDEEWAKVRAHAITLIEAANLLMIPGRKVAQPGKALQDEGTPGVLKASDIQALIDADHTAFASRALALHDAGVAALKAIDEKNASALSDVGGAIDEACENCHTKYWYPTAPAPPSTIPAPPADPAKTQ
jgi:hypothetical protein